MAASFLVWGLWLLAFLVLEGLAISGRVPWTTLSQFAWALEALKPHLRWVLFAFLSLVASHIATGWPPLTWPPGSS